MRYTYYTHNRIHEGSYEDNVEWLNSQYKKYGDRIVFADISPRPDVGYVASIIVKDLTKFQPQQQKIQL